MFGELVRYRGLLGMLAWRDIRVRYKQSLLGVAWAFLMPLIQTAVLVLVFAYSGAITIDDTKLGGMPYMLFVLAESSLGHFLMPPLPPAWSALPATAGW